MEQPNGVVVVAPAGSSLAIALLAALRAHGWDASGPSHLPVPHLVGRSTLLVVEDDSGGPALIGPTNAVAGGVIAVGSVRSLPLLISLARRGAWVVNQATPFTALLALVEQALREPADRAAVAKQVPALRRRAAEHAALSRLTEAEADALDGLVAGLSAAEIARVSHRSMHTVRSHIKAVLAKLEVSSQMAAVAVAHRAGPTGSLSDPRRRYLPTFGSDD